MKQSATNITSYLLYLEILPCGVTKRLTVIMIFNVKHIDTVLYKNVTIKAYYLIFS